MLRISSPKLHKVADTITNKRFFNAAPKQYKPLEHINPKSLAPVISALIEKNKLVSIAQHANTLTQSINLFHDTPGYLADETNYQNAKAFGETNFRGA